jgi:hypothetical protein
MAAWLLDWAAAVAARVLAILVGVAAAREQQWSSTVAAVGLLEQHPCYLQEAAASTGMLAELEFGCFLVVVEVVPALMAVVVVEVSPLSLC